MSVFDPFEGMAGDPGAPPAPPPPDPNAASDPNQPASAPPAPAAPPGAPAPASPAEAQAPQVAPVGDFRQGQLVKTSLGYAVIVATGPAPRVNDVGEVVPEPGYVIARFGDANESPHTAQELGLEAI